MDSEPDWEANYAYYALHKFHILPHVFLDLEENEKAFVCAAVDIRVKNEKKAQKDAERKSRKH